MAVCSTAACSGVSVGLLDAVVRATGDDVLAVVYSYEDSCGTGFGPRRFSADQLSTTL
jgi:hypothetical protein